jgi:hypothetical protein
MIEIGLWYLWLCCLCSGIMATIMIWEIRSDQKSARVKPDAERCDADVHVIPASALAMQDARPPRFVNGLEAVEHVKAG